MKISLVWPLVVQFDGGSFDPPNADEVCYALCGAWAGKPPMKAEPEKGRHELSFEVPYFGAGLHHITAAKRVFVSSFGINPDVEVDGVTLEDFAWRQQAGKIYRQKLIDNTLTALRRGHPDPQKADARVAITRGLNLTEAEIVAKVDAEARREAKL